jgi:hypothetical protein
MCSYRFAPHIIIIVVMRQLVLEYAKLELETVFAQGTHHTRQAGDLIGEHYPQLTLTPQERIEKTCADGVRGSTGVIPPPENYWDVLIDPGSSLGLTPDVTMLRARP